MIKILFPKMQFAGGFEQFMRCEWPLVVPIPVPLDSSTPPNLDYYLSLTAGFNALEPSSMWLGGAQKQPVHTPQALTGVVSINPVKTEGADQKNFAERYRAAVREANTFDFYGDRYATVAEIVGPNPELDPNQDEISVHRLLTYGTRMKEGIWNWNKMRSWDSTGSRVVDDPMKVGVTPSGYRFIINGHHRFVAAKMTGQTIPEHAFLYIKQKEVSAKYRGRWDDVDFLHVEFDTRYPVLTPPPSPY